MTQEYQDKNETNMDIRKNTNKLVAVLQTSVVSQTTAMKALY